MKISDYVTLETAKLLKAAGYPQNCETSYKDEELVSRRNGLIGEYAAPHLWDAMKWLRDEHKIHIAIRLLHNGWKFDILNIEYCVELKRHTISASKFTFYEDAAKAGIRAAMEYLPIDYKVWISIYEDRKKGGEG